MILRIGLFTSAILFAVGCERNGSAPIDSAKTTNQPEPPAEILPDAEEPKVGTVAENGNLIIHVFHSVDTPPVVLPVELEDDYGFMIFNEGTLEEPVLKVKIASRQGMKLDEANTWEDTDMILSKIPEGSGIHYYGKCLCPTFYGLPDDTWDRFMALVQKHKLAHDDTQDRITCNCFQNGG